MTKRKFYKKVLLVTILSESPYESNDLDTVAYDIVQGDCSGTVECTYQKTINGIEAAKELTNQGSEPSFFRLNEDGTDMEEDFNDEENQNIVNKRANRQEEVDVEFIDREKDIEQARKFDKYIKKHLLTSSEKKN